MKVLRDANHQEAFTVNRLPFAPPQRWFDEAEAKLCLLIVWRGKAVYCALDWQAATLCGKSLVQFFWVNAATGSDVTVLSLLLVNKLFL